jgi:hypothetical protein
LRAPSTASRCASIPRGDLEALLASAPLTVRPVSGRRDPLAAHGQVALERLAMLETPCAAASRNQQETRVAAGETCPAPVGLSSAFRGSMGRHLSGFF